LPFIAIVIAGIIFSFGVISLFFFTITRYIIYGLLINLFTIIFMIFWILSFVSIC
jgi:hypothetical protein